MVTSQKINEKKMRYRGSKSKFQLALPIESFVKEQRVDGGYFGLFHILAKNNSKLRCTLMGFERNYQIRVLSNTIKNQRSFYTFSCIGVRGLVRSQAPLGLHGGESGRAFSYYPPKLVLSNSEQLIKP